MRKLTILQTCVNLIYFFGILALAMMLIFIPMMFLGEADFPVKLGGEPFSTEHWSAKILLVFMTIGALVFFYGIHLLRITLQFFRKRDAFNPAVIANFNKIGWCIVASAVLTTVPAIVYDATVESKIGFDIAAGFGLDSFLVSLALGLLFMVIAEAFNIAKKMKEENELTI